MIDATPILRKRPALLFAMFVSQAANAHHGIDFITVQTAHLPEAGTGYAFVRADHVAGDEDETELEPAVLYGLSDRVSVELHTHFASHAGESLEYEAVAPALNVRLTPRQSNFTAGLSAEYEFQRHADENDVAGLTLMSSWRLSDWMLGAHARMEKPSGEDAEWSYAAGLRRALNDRMGLGLEFNGSFETSDANEVILGFYGELTRRFTLNAGVGTGPGEGADWSLRTAFIWRFR